MRLQVFDPVARFECGSCGWCCDQPWATVISAEDAKKYDAIDWAAEHPQLKKRKLYRKVKAGKAVRYELTKSRANRCIFLADDNRCIVHAKLGIENKPQMCRQFPYLPVSNAQDQRVSVNYGCRSVQLAHGKALSEQADEIAATVRPPVWPAANPAKASTISLTPDVQLPFALGSALLDRIAQRLSDSGKPTVVDGLISALDVLQAASETTADELARQLDPSADSRKDAAHASGGGASKSVSPVATPAQLPLASRMLFAATLYPDLADPRRSGLLSRFALIPKLMSVTQMRGGYSSRLLGRVVRVGDVFGERALPALSSDADFLLRRYFISRLWQRHPAGTRCSIVAGVHQHILDLAAVVYYSTLERAAGAGPAAPFSVEEVQRGLTIVEFHIANQQRLYELILQGWFGSALASLDVARQSLSLVRLAPSTAGVSA